MIGQFGPGRGAESGGVLVLLYVVVMTGSNMVLAPWGIIGALVGSGIGWMTAGVTTARSRTEVNNTVAAGILGGVFFIALTIIVVSSLESGVSRGAISLLAGVGLGAAVPSIYFQKQASIKTPKASEETNEMGENKN